MGKHLFAPGHGGCEGCGPAITMRMIVDTLGQDIVVVNATGCMEIISSQYPESSWRVPYIHSLFENAPAVAAGIAKCFEVKGRKTKVVCICGDGASYDIGFGSLSGMLERNDDVLFICYDNEAYMNTGLQRSGATPFMANTTTSQVGRKVRGKQEWKKPLAEIAAAHRIPYVATASIGFWKDFENKLKKAGGIRGARVLVVLAPCPPGWGSASELTVQLSKLAVECGIWKLVEIEGGRTTVNYKPKMLPVADYFKPQKRFRHLTEEDIANIGRRVADEWAQYDELSQHAAKVGELEKRIAELEKEKGAGGSGADAAKLKELNETIAKLKAELGEARGECDRRIAERAAGLEKKLAEVAAEKDGLSSKIAVYTKQIESDRQRIKELEESSARLGAELEKGQEAREQAYTAQAGGFGKAIEAAEGEFKKLVAVAKEDEKKLADILARHQEGRAKEQEMGALWEERKRLEDRIEHYSSELSEDSRRVGLLEGEMQKLLSELVLARKMGAGAEAGSAKK